MQIQGKVVIVTGGANGIGRALCLRFAKEGARFIAVSDVDETNGAKVAQEIGEGRAAFFRCDVSKEDQVKLLVDTVTKAAGQVDIFCSNAGIAVSGGPEATDRDWLRSWDINMLAHVYAARAVLPQMLARKEGYLLQTVSAAGLLTSPRLRALCGYKTCCAGLCRMDGHHLWRSGDSRLRALPARRTYEHAQRATTPAQGCCWRVQSSPSRLPMTW